MKSDHEAVGSEKGSRKSSKRKSVKVNGSVSRVSAGASSEQRQSPEGSNDLPPIVSFPNRKRTISFDVDLETRRQSIAGAPPVIFNVRESLLPSLQTPTVYSSFTVSETVATPATLWLQLSDFVGLLSVSASNGFGQCNAKFILK